MCGYLEFNHKKATQVLNFLANMAGGSIDKLKAIKLIYFADRYHLRKYGRLITNDEYYAMKLGPVASGVKDIADMSTFLGDEESEYAKKHLVITKDNLIKSVTDDNNYDKVFSKSDIESLRFAWEKFGKLAGNFLVEMTHKYPDWKKHELKLKTNSRVKMNCEDFFEDPENGVELCHPLDPEDRKYKLEHLKELSDIDALWS